MVEFHKGNKIMNSFFVKNIEPKFKHSNVKTN